MTWTGSLSTKKVLYTCLSHDLPHPPFVMVTTYAAVVQSLRTQVGQLIGENEALKEEVERLRREVRR